MRIRTPEEVVFIGTIVETYQRSGKHIVNVSLDLLRMDLELEGPIEMHLGDKVALSATFTPRALEPHIPREKPKGAS